MASLKQEGEKFNVSKFFDWEGFDRNEALRSLMRNPNVLPTNRRLNLTASIC